MNEHNIDNKNIKCCTNQWVMASQLVRHILMWANDGLYTNNMGLSLFFKIDFVVKLSDLIGMTQRDETERGLFLDAMKLRRS